MKPSIFTPSSSMSLHPLSLLLCTLLLFTLFKHSQDNYLSHSTFISLHQSPFTNSLYSHSSCYFPLSLNIYMTQSILTPSTSMNLNPLSLSSLTFLLFTLFEHSNDPFHLYTFQIYELTSTLFILIHSSSFHPLYSHSSFLFFSPF